MNGALLCALEGARLDAVLDVAQTSVKVLVGYLVVVGVINLWAHRSRSRRVKRLAQTLSPRFMGIAFAWVIATAGPAGALSATPSPSLPDRAQQDPSALTAGVDASTPPVMRLIEVPDEPRTDMPWMTQVDASGESVDSPGESLSEHVASASSEVPSSSTSVDPSDSNQSPGGTPAFASTNTMTHVVTPGDHFWSIAEGVLTATYGSTPDEASVAEYWVVLVDANRSRLIDPNNPDLIFPGQELVLPLIPR